MDGVLLSIGSRTDTGSGSTVPTSVTSLSGVETEDQGPFTSRGQADTSPTHQGMVSGTNRGQRSISNKATTTPGLSCSFGPSRTSRLVGKDVVTCEHGARTRDVDPFFSCRPYPESLRPVPGVETETLDGSQSTVETDPERTRF